MKSWATGKLGNQPSGQSTNQPINQPTNQSMNQQTTKKPTNQQTNQSIDLIFFKPHKYFHIFVATAPEANDPQPTFEDATQGATSVTKRSGNVY